MKNKKIIIPAIILGVVATGAIIWKTNIASAYFGNSEENRDKMAEELAAKLNVDKDHVVASLEEIRAEHQVERKAKLVFNLDKAVADGVITAEQKQMILDKIVENQSQRQETQKKRQQKMTGMQQWFSDNGIDATKLKNYISFGFGRGNRDVNADNEN